MTFLSFRDACSADPESNSSHLFGFGLAAFGGAPE